MLQCGVTWEPLAGSFSSWSSSSCWWSLLTDGTQTGESNTSSLCSGLFCPMNFLNLLWFLFVLEILWGSDVFFRRLFWDVNSFGKRASCSFVCLWVEGRLGSRPPSLQIHRMHMVSLSTRFPFSLTQTVTHPPYDSQLFKLSLVTK